MTRSKRRGARWAGVQFRYKAMVRALEKAGGVLSASALEKACGVRPGERRRFAEFLRSLVRRGALEWRGGYRLPSAPGANGPGRKARPQPALSELPGGGWREGRIRPGEAGDAWLVDDDGAHPPLLLPRALLSGILPGDRVRAARDDGGPVRRVDLVRHEAAELVGVTRAQRRRVYVEIDAPRPGLRLYLERRSAQPPPGMVVKVRVTRHACGRVRVPPDGRGAEHVPWGVVDEVLGPTGDSGAERERLLQRYGFSRAFPPAALDAARLIPRAMRGADRDGRADLRALSFLAADEDGDTLLHAERDADGRIRVRLCVADVAHFVPPGSLLDACAAARGLSLRLEDECVPMLPPRLSSDLASLLSAAPRPAITVELVLAADGSVVSRRLYESAVGCAGWVAPDGALVVLAGARAPLLEGLALLGEAAGRLEAVPGRRVWADACRVLRAAAEEAVARWLEDHGLPVLRLNGGCPFSRPLHGYAAVIVHQSLKAAFSGAPPPRSTEALRVEAGRYSIRLWQAEQVRRVDDQVDRERRAEGEACPRVASLEDVSPYEPDSREET